MRALHGILSGVLAAAAGAWAAEPQRGGGPRPAAPRPNVVFIIIDNVDFCHFGRCYGGTGLTPHLDRIAERGVTFTRAYATTPLCVPSRYTCLTGRYGTRSQGGTDMEDDGDEEGGGHIALEADRPNLPSVLRSAGYATGFVGKYHLERDRYLPRYAGAGSSVFGPEADTWLKARNAWLADRIRARGFDFVFDAIDFRGSQFRGIDFEGAEHNPEAEVLGALRFIDASRDRPFFLYLSTRLLHLAIHPELMLKDYARYGRVTEGGLLPEAPGVPMPPRSAIHAAARAAGATTPQQYGMHWLDAGIGAVVARLEERGLLDNTLLVVFSDNNMRGKETLYEGGARVPLLMMWPARLKAGTTCTRIVANTDFAPTFFDACGAKAPDGMALDGRSMLPVLDDPAAPWRDGLLLENGRTRAVVTDRWKYVALRYPPDVQAKIEEADRTGVYPRLSPKARTVLEKMKSTLTPERWRFVRNSWRWHTPNNNYMKHLDEFPFQFDADQLFDIGAFGPDGNESENVAARPENAAVLAAMKARLASLLATADVPFGEFTSTARTRR